MLKKILPPAIALFVLTLLFEVLTRSEWLNPALFPPPSQVFKVLLELRSDFLQAFFETAFNVGRGYLLSVVFGVLLAIVFSLNDFFRRSILPFAIFFQTVPIIAVAPLLVIYFGFGAPTVVAASLIVSIFPVIANTLMGLDSVRRDHQDLFKIYKASAWQTLWRLKIPGSYPQVYTGIRVSAGLAVIGAVAGEFVAGGGLGAMIDSARTQQRIDIVFAAILILSLLGLFIIGLVDLVDWSVRRWRPLR